MFQAGSIIGGYPATGIKSIQQGTTTFAVGNLTVTQAITQVDLNNSIVLWLGSICNLSSGDYSIGNSYLQFTSNVQLTATRGFQNGANTQTVSWMVLEFYPGLIKSVQQVLVTFTGLAATTTQAITSVNTAKTVLLYGGYSQPSGGTVAFNEAFNLAHMVLTSNVLITGTLGGNPGDARYGNTVALTVVEFY